MGNVSKYPVSGGGGAATLPISGAGGGTLSESSGTLTLLDNAAAGVTGTIINTTVTKGAGNYVLDVQNNGVSRFQVWGGGNIHCVGDIKLDANVRYQVAGSGLIQEAANATIIIYGNKNAADTGDELQVNSSVTRTAGNLATFQNNLSTRTAIDFTGKLKFIGAAGAKAAGTATLALGTATVATTAIKTGDIVLVTLNTPGGTLGAHYATPVASLTTGTSFVINSVSTAGATVTTDTSTVNWMILGAA